jgi:serine/threonine protein kinase
MKHKNIIEVFKYDYLFYVNIYFYFCDDKLYFKLFEVYISGGVLHLVLEFCSYDLEKVIRDKSLYLQTHHVKSYIKMLMEGLQHCHAHFILHRGI